MKIAVCMKYVPDTAARIRVTADGKAVDLTGVTYVINPYDEFAVEEALQIKERLGGEVIVITAGSERASPGLRTCLAMGADRAILVQDEALESADSFTLGAVLARVCRGLGPDLVLFGKQAIGVDNGQVSAVVAELLDLPQVSAVLKLELKDGTFRAEREIEGGREILEGTLPAVFTAQKGLNNPRYASLKGIMAAKKKPIDVQTVASLGLSADDLVARLATVQVALPPPRPPGRILTGDVSETVPQLVRLLHEEAKLI
ncbi:MAG: electron transfer flavoprotein subunit beta/FixA family protein [Acidobacteria bacterium]|nr:electron transfer flavoprotein subunit beta/FixA family protein [Acidobacteriota bacterium]